MTDTKHTRPDLVGDIEAVRNTITNLDIVSINSDTDIMEDQNDMFASALDSPTDSGLETLDISADNNDEFRKTPTSDTMEDLSMQVRILDSS